MTTARKLGLLSALYLSQGLPYGFFTQALPVLMRKEHLSLGAIGLSQLLAMPWALKFLWSPLMDRFGSERFGKRRSFLVPLQLLTVCALLVVSAMEPSADFRPIFLMVLVINVLAATQDIATDALAVDLLSDRERGLGNGVQVAGYRVGMIIGGGALLWLYDGLAWMGATQIAAAILLAATLPIFLHLERPAAPVERIPAREAFSWLRLPGARAWLAVLLVYKTGDALATAPLRTFLVDRGMEMREIGVLLGMLAFATGFAGAIAGGALVNVLGRRNALVAFGVLQSLSVAGYALAASVHHDGLLYTVVGLEHLTGGMATAALFTIMMDVSRPERAATDYTLQASVVVIASGVAISASGFLAEAMTYAPFFALSSILSLAGTIAVGVMWPRTRAARALFPEAR